MDVNSEAREPSRLQRLHSYRILDTPPDAAFDDLVHLAAEICDMPIAAVMLIDEKRRWFKSSLGLPVCEMERALAFCNFTIRDTTPFIVPDAREDPRFSQGHLTAGEPYLCFYTGTPLVSVSGQVLGTLSVMDHVPRKLTAAQLNSLQVVTRQVVNLLELQVLRAKHEQVLSAHGMVAAKVQRQAEHLATVQRIAQIGSWEMVSSENHLTWSDEVYHIYGVEQTDTPITFSSYAAFVHPDDLPALLVAQAKTLAGEAGYDIEYRILWPTGEVRHVHERAEYKILAETKDIWLAGSVQDVTEQKRTLRLIESFFDLSIALLGIMRMDGLLTKVNHTFEQTVGRSAEELTSIPFVEFVHPDDQAKTLAEILRFSTGDKPVDFETRCLTKKGTYRLITWSALPVVEDGVVYCIGRDITEANETREALRASEERFRHMAEIVDEVFWIYHPEMNRIIYASPRYETVFGGSREELYKDPRSYQRNIHPEDLARLKAATERDRYSLDIDYRLLLPDGETRWINVRTFAVRDANDNVTHSVGISRDITALMQTTQRLRASEEQYRLLFTYNPHPMWVYDYHSLQFLAVNDAAIAQYGYSEAEFLTLTLNDIRCQEDNKLQIEKWTATGQHLQRRVEAIWRHRRKDGSLIDVEMVSDVIEFNGKQARIALANNISTRLRAEAQVREQAALLDKAQDAIMVRDLSHRITYWNRSAERLYGWRAEEVIGRRVDELLHKDRNAFERAHQEVMERGEWFGELQKVDRNGRTLLIEGRWTLVHDEAGKPRAILTINTDITERKKLEAHFLRAQRMESIGTLAGGIAHDLNNLLAPIMLSLGLLKRQNRTVSELKQLDILETSAQRAADLVRQVLAFARGVDGDRTVVNVAQVAKDLEPLIRDTFNRNIRFEVQIDSDLLTVIGDPTQIHQVLLNLCVNARDAMPEGGKLQVTVSIVNLVSQHVPMHPAAKPGCYVVLKVSDTGTGIPQAIRERIFDPFFTTKDVGKGTGLGLATVQAVVSSHGGFIHLYTEEGRGTQFNIYLPAFEDGHAANATVLPSQLPQGHGELILVVDDESAVRLTTQQVLESYGYRVLTAENGAEAVTLYEQHRDEIAIVLTDMMMPVMDGLATIQALQKINPTVTIIAASGLAAYDMVAKAASLGIQHFLHKPYTAEAMFNILAEILESS